MQAAVLKRAAPRGLLENGRDVRRRFAELKRDVRLGDLDGIHQAKLNP